MLEYFISESEIKKINEKFGASKFSSDVLDLIQDPPYEIGDIIQTTGA
jgi:hypothetical protein